jgi:ATP-binding cassette subfamily C exporter for protease/lipase
MLMVMGLLETIRSRVLVRLGAALDERLANRIFSATFRKSLSAAEVDRGQALRDLDGLRQFLTSSAPFALFDAPWTPVFLLLIFIFHPLLGVIALVGAILLFGLALANELRTRPTLDEAGRHSAEASLFAQTSLRNADAIQAMGMMPAL